MNRHTSPDRRLIDELTSDMPDDVREEYEERAAVLEFDGGMTRECAEFASVALVLLRRSPGHYGVLPARLGPGRHPGITLAPPGSPRTVWGPSWADLAAAVRALGGAAALVPIPASGEAPDTHQSVPNDAPTEALKK